MNQNDQTIEKTGPICSSIKQSNKEQKQKIDHKDVHNPADRVGTIVGKPNIKVKTDDQTGIQLTEIDGQHGDIQRPDTPSKIA